VVVTPSAQTERPELAGHAPETRARPAAADVSALERDLVKAILTDGPLPGRALARRLAALPPGLSAIEDVLAATSDTEIATTVATALPSSAEGAEVLASALTNPNGAVRTILIRQYASALAAIPGASHEVVRRTAELDPCPAVRAAAVALLGDLASPTDAAPLLGIVLAERDASVRQEAVVALACASPRESLGTLERVATAEAESDEVRESAVVAISRVGDERAVSALDRISGQRRSGVAERARALADSVRARLQSELGLQNTSLGM
jgi:HEAT repeat protein